MMQVAEGGWGHTEGARCERLGCKPLARRMMGPPTAVASPYHGAEHDEKPGCQFAPKCTPIDEVEEESVEFEITTRYAGGAYGWEWKATGPGVGQNMGRYASRAEAKEGAERWCDRKAKQERGPETYKYKAKAV